MTGAPSRRAGPPPTPAGSTSPRSPCRPTPRAARTSSRRRRRRRSSSRVRLPRLAGPGGGGAGGLLRPPGLRCAAGGSGARAGPGLWRGEEPRGSGGGGSALAAVRGHGQRRHRGHRPPALTPNGGARGRVPVSRGKL